MSYKYVQKCDCCETRFSEIAIPLINVKHKTALADLMIESLNGNDMEGSFSLKCTDDLIVACNYQYANKKEEKNSKEMCEDLHGIAYDFYVAQTQGAETQHHCFDLSSCGDGERLAAQDKTHLNKAAA